MLQGDALAVMTTMPCKYSFIKTTKPDLHPKRNMQAQSSLGRRMHAALPVAKHDRRQPVPCAAKVVSDKVRKQIEERERAAAADDEARALSARQIGQLQGEIAGMLLPGETVTRCSNCSTNGTHHCVLADNLV